MVDAETLHLIADGDVKIGTHLKAPSGHIVEAGSLVDDVADVESCVSSPEDPVAVFLAGSFPTVEGQ
jgi:hypothetical protein